MLYDRFFLTSENDVLFCAVAPGAAPPAAPPLKSSFSALLLGQTNTSVVMSCVRMISHIDWVTSCWMPAAPNGSRAALPLVPSLAPVGAVPVGVLAADRVRG